MRISNHHHRGQGLGLNDDGIFLSRKREEEVQGLWNGIEDALRKSLVDELPTSRGDSLQAGVDRDSAAEVLDRMAGR